MVLPPGPFLFGASLFTADLISKLKKLDKRLYLSDKSMGGGDREILGLYRLYTGRQETILGATDTERQVLEQHDELICGVPREWVPERTEYAPNGTILKRGLKSIAKTLVNKGYDPQDVRKHLGAAILDYDRSNDA